MNKDWFDLPDICKKCLEGTGMPDCPLDFDPEECEKGNYEQEKRTMDIASSIKDDYIEHLKDLAINLIGKDILTDGEVQMLDTIGEELEWAIAWEQWSVTSGRP